MKSKKSGYRYKVTPVFLGVLAFIILVAGAILYELNLNEKRIVDSYNVQQDKVVSSLAILVDEKLYEVDDDDDIVLVMPQIYKASGNSYLVLETDQEIIFAKTVSATSKLYNNRNSLVYWNLVKEDNVQISSFDWNHEGRVYTLSLVTDTQSIYDSAGVIQHNYYILFTMIIVSIVLFSLLVTYVGMLDRANYNLSKTQNELVARNTNVEEYINNEIDSRRNAQGPHTDSEFEKTYSQLEKFMDVSVLRALLSKSNTDDLKPIKMIVFKFLMSERYYTVSEILGFAENISDNLKVREAMFEICKGTFAVVVYKTNDSETELRKNALVQILERENSKSNLFRGFKTSVYSLGDGEDAVIEDFEVACKEIVGGNHEV